eukprot:7131430-Pyramimonas_sp.AAC.1
MAASWAPVHDLKRRKQCFDSSWRSNPGMDRSTDADPGGAVKHAARSFSRVASARSWVINPLRNATLMSREAMIHIFLHAAVLASNI